MKALQHAAMIKSCRPSPVDLRSKQTSLACCATQTLLASTLMASLMLGAGCSEPAKSQASNAATAATVVDLDAAKALALVKAGKVQVLDVRTPAEFKAGHIAAALNHSVTDDSFAAAVSALNKDQPILVHCAAGAPGGRSRRAVTTLKAAGVKTIYHLDGGFGAWSAAKNPTVKGTK